MKSCIYEGQVSHARMRPVRHAFRYRTFMMYVDLDELPGLFDKRWLWSSTRPALARFRRERHLGTGDLRDAVRSRVEEETGSRPQGPIRLLTNFSYFGYWFNPVSFYYCFSADESRVEAIVVEVNNTPWGEQHSYVRACPPDTHRWRFEVDKEMHVSPFMPMDVQYTWALGRPADTLSVFMANEVQGDRTFKACLSLRRKRISALSLAGVLLRYPAQTLTTIFAIHWQAVRLWLKRCPIYPHPGKRHMKLETS